MLPKKHRLRAAHFASPTNMLAKTPLFSLKGRKNGGKDNRFAVLVGKKIDSRAAARNRLRRIVYDELSRWRRGGYDVMVILTQAIKTAGREDIRRALDEACSKFISPQS